MIGIVAGAGAESLYAIETAKKLGFTVISFDGNESAEGLYAADEHYVLDIRKPEQIVEALGDRRPDAVIPVPIGRYLISGAYINDYYGLKGISENAAQNCTDKYKFHCKLHDKGLRDSECILIHSGESNMQKMPKGYPVIVKPRYGSGSRSVAEYFSGEELITDFLDNAPFNEDYIVESAFQGTEYGIDGAVINGVLHIILIRKKLLTNPPARQCIGYMSVKDKELYKRVNNYLMHVVKELGINQTVFHADMLDDGENVFAVELSGRPSGHNLHNIFTPYAAGVDMVAEYLKFCMDMPYSFEPHNIKNMIIRYFDFEDCRAISVPDKQELLEEYPLISYECNIKEGEYLGKVKDGHSVMGRGYFILEGENEQELILNSEKILGRFRLQDGGMG